MTVGLTLGECACAMYGQCTWSHGADTKHLFQLLPLDIFETEFLTEL